MQQFNKFEAAMQAKLSQIQIQGDKIGAFGVRKSATQFHSDASQPSGVDFRQI